MKTHRSILLHLVLFAGALVFMVPLYWLVTTSLKPDYRVGVFPPDLYPVKQETWTIGGVEKNVYITTKPGWEGVGVGKLKDLPDGKWLVALVGEGRHEHPPGEPKPMYDGSGDEYAVDSDYLSPSLVPALRWKNYSDALRFLPDEYNFGVVPLVNTIIVTVLSILGTVLSSSLVAFSFARLRWPGRDVMFGIVLATMMIPGAVTMLPVFLIFRALGWVDTLTALWAPSFFAGAFSVFLLRQFFLTIPGELEDAAKIDGCSYFAIYWRVMLPLVKPALAALTVMTFMGGWNNFMGPLIYINSPEKMTLAYALQLFQGAHGGEPGMMMAAATLVTIPVIAIFFGAQKYMIEGVTLTGIKG